MKTIKIATVPKIEFLSYYESKQYQRHEFDRLTLRRYQTNNQKIILDEKK